MIAYSIHTCPEYGGIFAPIVVCDACSQTITHNGNAYWLVLDDGSIHPQVWHTHKAPCSSFDRHIEQAHGGMVMSEELSLWLEQLGHNFARENADG